MFLQHERITVPCELNEAEIVNTSNCNWVHLCASGTFRRERSNRDHVGTETRLDQLEFLLINDGTTEGWVELFGVCTTRVCLEQHLSMLSQFEQVLQNGQVLGGVWTDLLDQDGPPAEAVERPERNELNEEGLGEQVPSERIRINSKATDTAAQIESDEDGFTIQEEKDHESRRHFHRQQELKRQREQSRLAKQVVYQEWLLESPSLCLKRMWSMQTWTQPRL